MILRRTDNNAIRLEMSGAEAKALLNELLDVPGGSRLPKIRQACHLLGLWHRFGEDPGEDPRNVVRRKKKEAPR